MFAEVSIVCGYSRGETVLSLSDPDRLFMSVLISLRGSN